MRMDLYRPRFRTLNIIIAIFSIVCTVVLAILIPIERRTLTFQEWTPLLIAIYCVGGLMGCCLLFFSVINVKEYVSHFRNQRNDTYLFVQQKHFYVKYLYNVVFYSYP